ncbi:Bug family tripartite tricarboxylate transporter substrate binding protein [Rhodoferax sediminis]|uniref:Tripartite tricarboxylate transporter substrate binding protein n=1 Tax=Rhodoferax sediminis TaxID=2509614 RepID=A0A515DDY3_9BURK|nr:tripartite tricarboxylate transporter substrate binding protein [Rhodoferax sediminis]QDL38624.1 tripartite tricarboxylate transporter substrate binding protein [Rhodoferax sediminis]
MKRRNFCALIVTLAASASPALQAQEKYPSRPIRIIVPFTAGGVGDTVARIISQPLGELLGQSVIVENRPGGDSVTGTEYAARMPPDGYTILQVSTPQTINMVLREKPRYDLLRDFAPVARVAGSTLVLVVPATASPRSVADLIAYGKTKPGGLSYGSGAVGSVGHLSGELLKRAGGVTALHVPYKGNSAVIPDLVGGRLDFFFASQPEAVQGVAGGHLRALAVTATRRVPTFPDVPTMIESGFPGFDPASNYGYLVPAGTPAPVVRQLGDAIGKVVASPAVQERFQALGLTSSFGGPDELAATLKGEIARWGQVVKAANIRPE